MGNRILIFGTSYVANAAAAFTYRLWAHVLRERNPGAYILAVDTRAEFGSARIDGVGRSPTAGQHRSFVEEWSGWMGPGLDVRHRLWIVRW